MGRNIVFMLMGGVVLSGLATYWVMHPQKTAPPVSVENHIPNASAGEQIFKRYCTSCHSITAPDGTRIAGRGARSGPNLWAVANGRSASDPKYRYSRSFQKANFIWAVDSFTIYLQDPSNYLKTVTNDTRARSKMSFRLRGSDAAIKAADIYAYLESLQP